MKLHRHSSVVCNRGHNCNDEVYNSKPTSSRVANGSTSFNLVKQLKIQQDYRENETIYQKSNESHQTRDFQRLPDDVIHVDNVGLNSKYSVSVRRSSKTDLGCYDIDQIMIKNDYKLDCDRPTLV